MGQSIVTAPDGSKLKITHPDDATDEEIAAYAQKTYGTAKTSERPAGNWTDAAKGVAKSTFAGIAAIPATTAGLAAKAVVNSPVPMIMRAATGKPILQPGRDVQRKVEEALTFYTPGEAATDKEGAAMAAMEAAGSAIPRFAGKVGGPLAEEAASDILKATAATGVGALGRVGVRAVPKPTPKLTPVEVRMAQDANVKTMFEKQIAEKRAEADPHYTKVRETVGESTRVDLAKAKAYINKRIEDVGGDMTSLSPGEKLLAAMFTRSKPPAVTAGAMTPEGIAQRNAYRDWRSKQPKGDSTYGNLDQVRQDIGSTLSRGDRRDRSLNKKAYDALTEDQAVIADAHGVLGDLTKGRNIASQYLRMEERFRDTYGKKLDGSLLKKSDTAAERLLVGDLSNYRKLIKGVPPAMRAEIDAAVRAKVKDAAPSQGQLAGIIRHNPGLSVLAGIAADFGLSTIGLPPTATAGVIGSSAARARSMSKTTKRLDQAMKRQE